MNISLQADSMLTNQQKVIYKQWDSITVELLGEKPDLIFTNTLLDNQKSVKQLPLFLRPDTTETAFLITYHNQTDTLFVQHTPRQYFVSLACGCAIYHTITHAWSTDRRVDSIQIINASVENAAQENLRIFLNE